MYSHMEADPELLQAYRANAEALGPPLRGGRRRYAAAHVLHRHGQRVARRADHPSAHRHRDPRRGQPPARVRRRLRHARRPTPPCATARSRWPGRPSTPPPIRPCAPGCSARDHRARGARGHSRAGGRIHRRHGTGEGAHRRPARASSRCGSSGASSGPSCFLLLVEWETLEDHTEGFRGSAAYEEWRAALHHFYDPFPVVEHFEAVVTA